jgi:hypothetical protein
MPLVSRADYYYGASYADVIQAPTESCEYAVLGDNLGEYDLVMDSGGDLANGNYLYGAVGALGSQIVYNAAIKHGIKFYVEDTMMDLDMVSNQYYEDCPSYNYQ